MIPTARPVRFVPTASCNKTRQTIQRTPGRRSLKGATSDPEAGMRTDADERHGGDKAGPSEQED
jgi:hypothetical protein